MSECFNKCGSIFGSDPQKTIFIGSLSFIFTFLTSSFGLSIKSVFFPIAIASTLARSMCVKANEISLDIYLSSVRLL